MKTFPSHAVVSRTLSSPVGSLVLLAAPDGLAGLFFAHRVADHPLPPEDPANEHLDAAVTQLAEYFEGRRARFDLNLAVGGTEFQRRVWDALARIPFGETRSYRDLAEELGNPNSVRAVGLANGSNPVSIIVPCHRVIGAKGDLTGFGGGIEIKRQLLIHEGALLDVS